METIGYWHNENLRNDLMLIVTGIDGSWFYIYNQ